MQSAWLVTCEHASRHVPRRYRPLLSGADAVIRSHRGWDAGALDVARALGERFRAPLVAGAQTRLLVDLNRSPGHRQLFSEYTRGLPSEQKNDLLAACHWPYRGCVEDLVGHRIAAEVFVFHVSVHTFTPRLHGKTREADIGLLYDPGRPVERRLACAWQGELRAALPGLTVRRNYPYRGIADGLVTHLRRRFVHFYAGIELELNQSGCRGSGSGRFVAAVAECLAATVSRGLPAARRRREPRSRGPIRRSRHRGASRPC
jgi:predicted N-formylglutamate amidohydrolase